jgi:ATP-dependent helicase/nuclease subunit B
VTLSATSKEMAAEDRFYLYLLLTIPSETLTVSYRSQGDDGSAMLPGELAGLMKAMFEGLTEEDPESAALSELNSAESGAGLLAASMRSYLEKAREGRLREGPKEPERALYQWLRAHPEHKEDLERIGEGLYYAYRKDREMLSKATAGKLFGDTLNGSVSFFEKYAECPYGHFLRYGLKLEERAEYEVSVADLGTVLHNSIDAVFKRTKTGTEWYELQGEERDALIREEVEKVLLETNNGIFTETSRKEAQQERIIRIVTRTIKTLAEQWKAGSYSITKTEKDFGYDEALPELMISLSDGRELKLRGRIDRIDVSEDGNDRTVKIIDYKSSQKKLDYTKVWHGVQLQLPLYLLAAVEMEEKEHPEANVIPGGLYYYEVKDPVVTIEDSASPKTPEEVIAGQLRMKGVTNSDPAVAARIETALEGKVVPGLTITKKTGALDARANTASGAQLRRLGEFARGKARDLAEELISGDIRVEPYQYGGKTGCEYCSFKGVCGFDKSVRGYRYKELEPKKLEDIAPEEEGGTE